MDWDMSRRNERILSASPPQSASVEGYVTISGAGVGDTEVWRPFDVVEDVHHRIPVKYPRVRAVPAENADGVSQVRTGAQHPVHQTPEHGFHFF